MTTDPRTTRPGAVDAAGTARPLVVGILNVTPDSFSDGGRYDDRDAALAHARRMLDEGADLLDVGGESTRPGAARIDAAEQIRRTLPVIEAIIERAGRSATPRISIDTTRADVAAAALDAGAAMINDVSAGRDDAEMLPLAAARDVPVVLMHMRGQPATMQTDPVYRDVVAEVRDFLLERADAARAAGLKPGRIVLDPGIGFGKTFAHNLELLASLPTFVATGYPILVGVSRKRMLGEITGEKDPTKRHFATAAVTALAVAAGARMVRVHDVLANRHAADVAHALRSAAGGARRATR